MRDTMGLSADVWNVAAPLNSLLLELFIEP